MTPPDTRVGAVCDAGAMSSEALSRTAASHAVESIGWRYLLGCLSTSVAVTSFGQAVAVAAAAASACGSEADEHLRADVRADRVELTLQPQGATDLTTHDVELAHGITDAVRDLGLDTDGATSAAGGRRPVQSLELAIDAMDIGAIRPFWKAVMAYEDEAGPDGPQDALVDPVRQGPAIWFQQMNERRSQRNRIHFDMTVSHDEADARVAAALAHGGTLVTDRHARAFWVLADAEGNEVCVCTWEDRDDAGW
jgi:pterin-4a-carbinolamine dehydratase